MATITANKNYSSASAMNVLDPATWVGGAVPGPGDIARLPDLTPVYLRNSSNQGYMPWEGYSNFAAGAGRNNQFGTTTWYQQGIYVSDIQSSGYWTPTSAVAGGAIGTPGHSGSFYMSINPTTINNYSFVKINFTGSYTSSNDYFLSCSIDPAYNWVMGNTCSFSYDEWTPTEPPPVQIGFATYNQYVLPNWNRYELTGSGEWEVGAVYMGDQSKLVVKNDAKLTLVSPTAASYGECIDFRKYAAYNSAFHLLDQAKLINSGSSDESAQQDHGIYNYSSAGNTIIVSGSANYSSSFLSQSANAKDTTITITDSSSFDIGDIVTIQSTGSYHAATHVTGSNSPVNSTLKYQGVQVFDTASHDVLTAGSIDECDVMSDEVIRIVSRSGHTATVAKLHGRCGDIQQDMGTYSYRRFVETFGQTPDYYVGNRRAVLVDSFHKSYDKGDVLIINNKGYNVNYAGTYLSQSLFTDFTDDADPENILEPGVYHTSGSQYEMQGHSATYTWDEVYRKCTYWASGSFAGNPNVTTGAGPTTSLPNWTNGRPHRSFYLNSASGHTNFNYMAATHIIKNTYWDEGEIVVSGSLIRDQNGSLDSNTSIAFGWPVQPFWGGSGMDSTFPGGMTYNASNANYQNWYGLHGNYLRHSSTNQSYDTDIDMTGLYDHYPEELPAANYTASGESFHLKMVQEGPYLRQYYGDKAGETLTREVLNSGWSARRAAIALSIRRHASVYSIDIKQRYQLLVLNTEDSFSYQDEIKEGGLLLDQPANKKMKWMATEVEDPLGMKNLLWDYYHKKGDTNLIPYIQAFNRTGATDADADDNGLTYGGWYYYGSYIFDYAPGMNQGNFSHLWHGNNAHVVMDLGENVTFDTIGVMFGGQGEGTLNNYMKQVKIEVNTVPHTDTYTLVRAAEDDLRLSTTKPAMRHYTFASGSVTARFIKLTTNAGSGGTTFSDINRFFVHNMKAGQPGGYATTGSAGIPLECQLKLKNVNNFKVGDKVYLLSSHLGASGEFMKSNFYTSDPPIDSGDVTGVSTTGTADAAGGLRPDYTITAISASVITLDRTPGYCQVVPGTLVYKMNRGNVHISSSDARQTSGINVQSPTDAHIRVQNAYINCGRLYIPQSTAGCVHSPIVVEDTSVINLNQLWTGIYASFGLFRNNFTNASAYTMPNAYDYIANVRKFNNITTYAYAAYWQLYTDSVNSCHINFEEQYYSNNTNGLLLPSSNRYNKRYPDVKIHNIQYIGTYSPFTSLNADYFFNFGPSGGISTKNINQEGYYNNWRGAGGARSYSNSTAGYVKKDKIQNNQFFATPNVKNIGVSKQGYGMGGPTLEGAVYSPYGAFTGGPEVQTGGDIANTVITKEGNIYRIWEGVGSRYFHSRYRTRNGALSCQFSTTKDMNINIQLSMDYYVPFGQKHISGAGTVTYANNVANRTCFPTGMQPKIMLAEIGSHEKIIDLVELDQIEWTALDYNKTFSFKKDTTYIFQTFTQEDQNAAAGCMNWLNYKNLSFNLFVTEENMGQIKVLQNDWDSWKLFIGDEKDTGRNSTYTRNLGAYPLVRQSNNLGSKVRINKVKL